jgi:hypothetical protein
LTRHLLVIGGQRCGTTYLTALLDSHPDITMASPARPEPKVFLSAELAARGLDWYRATYFAHATSEQLLGEKSTSYIDVPQAAARARSVLDRADIVVQLRDPIARAVSNWRFSKENGLEHRPLVQALEDNLEGPLPWDPSVTSVSPFAYLERGRYADHLEPWLSSFPDSVHVTFLHDVVNQSSIGSLYADLGVDAEHRPSGMRDVVNESEGESPPLGAELEARLRDYFRDSDERLQAQLGRDVPW